MRYSKKLKSFYRETSGFSAQIVPRQIHVKGPAAVHHLPFVCYIRSCRFPSGLGALRLVAATFSNVELPRSDASKEDVVTRYRSGQPSYVLRQIGLWMCALRATQGQSERFWALTSRQATAIRNRPLPEAKIMICNIAADWRLLYPDVSCQHSSCKNVKFASWCEIIFRSTRKRIRETPQDYDYNTFAAPFFCRS